MEKKSMAKLFVSFFMTSFVMTVFLHSIHPAHAGGYTFFNMTASIKHHGRMVEIVHLGPHYQEERYQMESAAQKMIGLMATFNIGRERMDRPLFIFDPSRKPAGCKPEKPIKIMFDDTSHGFLVMTRCGENNVETKIFGIPKAYVVDDDLLGRTPRTLLVILELMNYFHRDQSISRAHARQLVIETADALFQTIIVLGAQNMIKHLEVPSEWEKMIESRFREDSLLLAEAMGIYQDYRQEYQTKDLILRRTMIQDRTRRFFDAITTMAKSIYRSLQILSRGNSMRHPNNTLTDRSLSESIRPLINILIKPELLETKKELSRPSEQTNATIPERAHKDSLVKKESMKKLNKKPRWWFWFAMIVLLALSSILRTKIKSIVRRGDTHKLPRFVQTFFERQQRKMEEREAYTTTLRHAQALLGTFAQQRNDHEALFTPEDLAAHQYFHAHIHKHPPAEELAKLTDELLAAIQRVQNAIEHRRMFELAQTLMNNIGNLVTSNPDLPTPFETKQLEHLQLALERAPNDAQSTRETLAELQGLVRTLSERAQEEQRVKTENAIAEERFWKLLAEIKRTLAELPVVKRSDLPVQLHVLLVEILKNGGCNGKIIAFIEEILRPNADVAATAAPPLKRAQRALRMLQNFQAKLPA